MRVYIGVPGKGGLTTVGEALRQAREARGISLENARGATGIPLHYLQAMESGDSKLIADEFYLIPFFRRYAQYLELDPAATVAQFLNDSHHLEDARPSFEPPRQSRRRIVGMVAVLLVLLAIAVAGWALFARRHGLGGSAAAQKVEPVQSSSRAAP